MPKSDVPGEASWPTQPFSTLPPSARQVVTADDLTPFLISDAERATWRERIGKARTGLFNPPALTESAVVPGAVGGTNWGNTAANPKRRHPLSTEPGLSVVLQAAAADGSQMSRVDAGVSARRIRGRCSAAAKAYEQSCAMCHGEDRAGTPAAPSLRDDRGADRQARSSAASLIRQRPHATHRPHRGRADRRHPGVPGWRRAAPHRRHRRAGRHPRGPGGCNRRAPRGRPPPARESVDSYPEGVAAPAQRYFTDYGLGYPYLWARRGRRSWRTT